MKNAETQFLHLQKSEIRSWWIKPLKQLQQPGHWNIDDTNGETGNGHQRESINGAAGSFRPCNQWMAPHDGSRYRLINSGSSQEPLEIGQQIQLWLWRRHQGIAINSRGTETSRLPRQHCTCEGAVRRGQRRHQAAQTRVKAMKYLSKTAFWQLLNDSGHRTHLPCHDLTAND